MIIVAGWLRVDPAVRERYLDGCSEVISAARQVPGCVDFTLSGDRLEPDRINVYEAWETAAALEAFRGSGPDDGQAAMITAAAVQQYEVAAVVDL